MAIVRHLELQELPEHPETQRTYSFVIARTPAQICRSISMDQHDESSRARKVSRPDSRLEPSRN